jgi:hypothetical protein
MAEAADQRSDLSQPRVATLGICPETCPEGQRPGLTARKMPARKCLPSCLRVSTRPQIRLELTWQSSAGLVGRGETLGHRCPACAGVAPRWDRCRSPKASIQRTRIRNAIHPGSKVVANPESLRRRPRFRLAEDCGGDARAAPGWPDTGQQHLWPVPEIGS